ncbi:MAG: hypothetical protein V4450_10955 [Bacteroidota bacterium]
MEDIELKNIWQSYDRKIAEAQVLNRQSWVLNLHCFENLQQQKAERKLRSLVRFKAWAVVLGIVFILFLGVLVFSSFSKNPFFSVSMGAIALFSLYAVVVYVQHIILIGQIRYDGSITETQQKLARLQSSTLRSTRIMWLQMPFYSTWFWSSAWIGSDAKFWLIAFPISLLFTLLSIYLYRNINLRNIHKKWVKALLMAGPEYKNIVMAMEFMKEIEDFKKDLL